MAGYKEAVEYIAMNDEPTFTDPAAMVGFPSVQVTAIIFNKQYETVAADVMRYRGHFPARTVDEVNRAIGLRGGKERLVYSRTGGPYFYFVNLGPNNVPGESITVSHVNAHTVAEWLEELEHHRAKQCK